MSSSTLFITRLNALRPAPPQRFISLRNVSFTAAPGGRFKNPNKHGGGFFTARTRPSMTEASQLNQRLFTNMRELRLEMNGELKPPARPKGWPTPIITQDHVDQYFPSLYSRGWSILYRAQKPKEDGAASEEIIVVPSLETRLMIQSKDMLLDLETLVRELEPKEKVSITLYIAFNNQISYQ